MSGELYINPVRANLFRNCERFGQMHPYTKIKLGKYSIVTEADMNGGQAPKWNRTLLIRRINEEKIEIEVWNMNRLFFNDLIGSATITFEELFEKLLMNRKFKEWVPLFYKGREAGHIYIKAVFIPDSGYLPNVISERRELEKLRQLDNLDTLMDTSRSNSDRDRETNSDSLEFRSSEFEKQTYKTFNEKEAEEDRPRNDTSALISDSADFP